MGANTVEPSYGRILSIENDPLAQQKVVDYLEDNGFTLFEAKTKEEGLKIFREEKPNLVLSDSTLDLLEVINKESPETPVIMISDQKLISEAVTALRLGAWDYILKPITDLTILERSICKALEHSRLIQENKVYRKALESANETLSQNLRTLEADQEAGRQVQLQLSPPKSCQMGSYCFEYKILPSLYLSGDFIDYFKMSDTLFGFYIADVSGHGASSAFITVILKSMISQMARSDIKQPHRVLKIISDEISKAKLGKYLTMVYCVLDMESNSLRYSVGGHYPKPILCDGKTANYLEGEGFAVGVFDKAEYQEYELKLPEKFSLVMYSDGILEAMQNKKLEISEKVLLEKSCDVNLTANTVFSRFGIHENDSQTHMPDDIAFLVLRKE